jgi:hypothetical protein
VLDLFAELSDGRVLPARFPRPLRQYR